MRKTSGNVAIEMAIALPIFLVLFMGILELNRYYWTGYWLNYCLQDSITSEALDPGFGVKNRLLDRIQNQLIDKALLSITEQKVMIGRLEISQYNVSYQTQFFFLPNKDLLIRSNSWLADNENDIN